MRGSAGTSHTQGAPRRGHPHEERRSGHASTAPGSPSSALPLRRFRPGSFAERFVRALSGMPDGAELSPRQAEVLDVLNSRVPRATREPGGQMKRVQMILWSPDTPSSGRPAVSVRRFPRLSPNVALQSRSGRQRRSNATATRPGPASRATRPATHFDAPEPRIRSQSRNPAAARSPEPRAIRAPVRLMSMTRPLTSPARPVSG
jgi:hypothetical protein